MENYAVDGDTFGAEGFDVAVTARNVHYCTGISPAGSEHRVVIDGADQSGTPGWREPPSQSRPSR
jgi:hypothetical protein